MPDEDIHPTSRDYPPTLVEATNVLGVGTPEKCTVPGCPNPTSPVVQADYANPIRNPSYTHYMCAECAQQYELGNMIQAGKPMDLAWRLLKGADDPPYDPDNPYWLDPKWKNYKDPDPLGAFGIPQSVWDDIAARQEEEGNKVDTPVETAMKVLNPRTENVYDSPDTHCELHGERLEPITNPQDIRQYPKGADKNMYCTACEQNITGQPRQPQQFDIDEDTREKLTGEPMDVAMRLLKDDELPNFCQSCEGASCKGCDNTGLDVSERFHQEHEPMSVDDMESYYDESHLGHIGRFEANPVEIFQDIIEDTPEGRRKQTNIMGATYRGEPTFNMMPLAGAGRSMVNPHAEIFRRSEPMDLAWRLLKTPVSPEAKRNKLEYDKKYQDNPKRVKYREELNRERRKRGVYGKGGKDMSHTKDGKIVPEDASKNRARHFKERGTLKSFVLVKR